MIYTAKKTDELKMRSMGKSLRIIAIADNDAEANAYMERHDSASCVACFGPFVLMADKYDNGQN